MGVIATAGHVDHGKSTLLAALTGRHPDRLAEEKRRGLTIDLGFTWMTLPSGREVSFVDVPGHERFIKNMLAGVEGIDVALFVVAADEGWMPQSEEHLAVLDLLGVQRAVVALTKVDRVDDELVEIASLEALERLEGTALAGSEIIPISAPSGHGLGELTRLLDSHIDDDEPTTGARMWIDRRFTIDGAGTVVTGTLLGGRLSVGDTLVAYPSGEKVRIRGLESHERPAEVALPRRRVAVNLSGASDELGRGDMLGGEGAWDPTERFTVDLTTARYVDELPPKGAYHLHVGSSVRPVRVRFLAGGALMRLDRPLPLRYGDRFILRETGRRAVVAGGIVLDPHPPLRGRSLASSASLPRDLDPDSAADALLEIRGIDALARLEAHSAGTPRRAVVVGDEALTESAHADLSARAVGLVDQFHAGSPLRPGLPFATLVSRLRLTPAMTRHVVDTTPELETDGLVTWKSGRRTSLTEEQHKSWLATREVLADAGLSPPKSSELPIEREVLHQMIRAGDIVQVSGEFVYLADDADRLREAITTMPGGFTVADFRDSVGVSRRHAVPILEWSDSEGMTRRVGDGRHVVDQTPGDSP